MELSIGHNQVFQEVGLNGFDWRFVQCATDIVLLKFCIENLHLKATFGPI